jgi:phosphoglycolate phosphatase
VPFAHCSVLVFDFDGTLADTFGVGLGIFNQLSAEFGFRPIMDEEIPAARKMSARELIDAYGISHRKVPQIAARGLKLLHARMGQVQPFAEIPEVLRTLKTRGYILGILTSNSEDNVRLFLDRHELTMFDFVRTSSRLFGKAREIRHLFREHRWPKETVALLGDECRDIEAAQKAQLPIVAVSWGFNSQEALAAQSPAALVHHPQELLSLFPELPSGKNAG